MKLALRDVYGDALKVYRLLMMRSILTAALVYAAVDGFDALSRLPDSTAAQVGLGLVSTVLYYRLTDPERPVIAEDVYRWDSVWAGPTAED